MKTKKKRKRRKLEEIDYINDVISTNNMAPR
jgi:hypothetical protein